MTSTQSGGESATIKFDKPDHKSPFLSFVAAEFKSRGTPLRRTLSTKTRVQDLLAEKRVGGMSLGLPTQHAVVTSPEAITTELLGERMALKFANGWSARGVMLLERVGEGHYFDSFSLRELSIHAIREKQRAIASSFGKKRPAWIAEELLNGPQPGTVPFDYKFYMFQGQIGAVLQIDRNASPPRVAIFDGDLQPMVEGYDYRLTSEDLQAGVPLVPRSAVMLSRWAIELSQMTDAPFVRVDLYDTERGPVFGEFTFSPGATHKRSFMFSEPRLEVFDQLFQDAEQELQGHTAQRKTLSSLLQRNDPVALAAHPQLSYDTYERMAASLYNQDRRGGTRLAEAQRRLPIDKGLASVNRYISRAHKATADWVRDRHPLAIHVRKEAARQVLAEGRSVEEVADEIGFPVRRMAALVRRSENDGEPAETSI